jgi:hypothetical protein
MEDPYQGFISVDASYSTVFTTATRTVTVGRMP